MRRVLVPLDGSPEAASILPEAKRLAGKDGELILLRDPIGSAWNGTRHGTDEAESVRQAVTDLEGYAEALRVQGASVETHALVMIDPAYAIDSAARVYHADMVACSTRGDGQLGRLVHGGVAWRALAGSSVPVLVRNAAPPSDYRSIFAPEPRIMVPLDGSQYAEKALDLAQELAAEWTSSIWLVHVVSHYPVTGLAHTDTDPASVTDEEARLSGRGYLDQVGKSLSVEVYKRVLFGPVAERLSAAARHWNIGHVVMTSHGRTGLRRTLLGSVADDLIRRLDCPIIVTPALAAERIQRSVAGEKRPAAPDFLSGSGQFARRAEGPNGMGSRVGRIFRTARAASRPCAMEPTTVDGPT